MLLGEVRSRLDFLVRVGLGYLTLDRQSRTLSGGEVQRINLTTALGTSLVNTLFVLDEPSIGLHPRDMRRVIEVMHRLRDNGNSLLVVEHDPQIMLTADRILDLGPGPGEHGGQIVFEGTPAELARGTDTLTAHYLSGRRDARRRAYPARARRRPMRRACGSCGRRRAQPQGHRRRGPAATGWSASPACPVRASPRWCRTCCTRRCCAPRASPPRRRARTAALARRRARERVSCMVDQTQIGRTTRSNPASYVGAFDAIRKRFAAEAVSIERGYTVGTFSFNSGNGRCPTCGGNGFEHVEMQFLSDVYLRCPDCDGRRYRPEILDVKIAARRGPGAQHRRRARHDRVAEAVDFFAGDATCSRGSSRWSPVGLDYLRLGQPVPTLSGGEAQRLKLAGHLADEGTGQRRGHRRLFLFDEPTTGLHFDDVAKLLGAFKRLLDAGHSLLVIEHNLDVIRAADWILDLGPEGGEAGGRAGGRGHAGRGHGMRAPRTRAARSPTTSGTRRPAGRGEPSAQLAGRDDRRTQRWSPTARARRSSCTRRASTTCATSTSRFRASGSRS